MIPIARSAWSADVIRARLSLKFNPFGNGTVNGVYSYAGTPTFPTSTFTAAVDHSGNVFVTDSCNNTIRKITPARVVTTLGDLALSPGTLDGTGMNARFNFPRAKAIDSAGKIYVGDVGNHTIRVGTP